MDIFRHYTDTGSTANKKLIQKKDDLDKNSIEQLLLQEFGLRVDMSLVKAGPSGSQGTDVTKTFWVILHLENISDFAECKTFAFNYN